MKHSRLFSRISHVQCFNCGKELEVPNMYGADRDILTPYCPTTTILYIQWLIYHGWHVTKHEATPSGAFLCPKCYSDEQPQYSKSQFCEKWVMQAKKWMSEKENKE